MVSTILLMVASLVLLYVGGETLVKGASSLALHMGISQLAIGLSVVAFGTSAPELAVSLDAALSGANDISVGNVVGSNIANIALILGLTALIKPIRVEAKIVRIDAPIMIVVSAVLVLVLLNGEASRVEGILLFIALLGFVFFTFWQSKKESEGVQTEFSSAAPESAPGMGKAALLLIAGLGMVMGGGHFLVEGAVSLAESFGMSQAAIGLTIVAFGTSVPELSTSLIAAKRGHSDIAVGNVVGSNIFNILCILGITAIVQPLQMGSLSWFDLGTMCVLSCLLLPILFTDYRIGRAEGLFLLISYVAYSGYLFVF